MAAPGAPGYLLLRWQLGLYDAEAALQDEGHLQAFLQRVTDRSISPGHGDRIVVMTGVNPRTGAPGDFVAAGRVISDVFPVDAARQSWVHGRYFLRDEAAPPTKAVMLGGQSSRRCGMS